MLQNHPDLGISQVMNPKLGQHRAPVLNSKQLTQMAAALLSGLYSYDNEDGEQFEHQNIMTDKLLESHDYALNFPEHVLMGISTAKMIN